MGDRARKNTELALDAGEQHLGDLLPSSEQEILSEAWSHKLRCKCGTCLSAWALVGWDECCPFTKEEIDAYKITRQEQ